MPKKKIIIGSLVLTGAVVSAIGAGVGLSLQTANNSATSRLNQAPEINPVLVSNLDLRSYTALDFQDKFVKEQLNQNIELITFEKIPDGLNYSVVSVSPIANTLAKDLNVQIKIEVADSTASRTYNRTIKGFAEFKSHTEALYQTLKADDFNFTIRLGSENKSSFSKEDFLFDLSNSSALPFKSKVRIESLKQLADGVELAFKVERTNDGITISSQTMTKALKILPEYQRLTQEAPNLAPQLLLAKARQHSANAFSNLEGYYLLEAKKVGRADFADLAASENVAYSFDTSQGIDGIEYLDEAGDNSTSIKVHLIKTSKIDPQEPPYAIKYALVLDKFTSTNMTKLLAQKKYDLSLKANSALKKLTPGRISLEMLNQQNLDFLDPETAQITNPNSNGFNYQIVAHSLVANNPSALDIDIEISFQGIKRVYRKRLGGFLTDRQMSRNVFESLKSEIENVLAKPDSGRKIIIAANNSLPDIYAQEFNATNFRFQLTPDNSHNLDLVSQTVRLNIEKVSFIDDNLEKSNEQGKLLVHAKLTLSGQESDQYSFKSEVKVQTKQAIDTKDIKAIINSLKAQNFIPSLLNTSFKDANKASQLTISHLNTFDVNSLRARQSNNLPSLFLHYQIVENSANDDLGELKVKTIISNHSSLEAQNLVSESLVSKISGFKSKYVENQKLINSFISQNLNIAFDGDKSQYLPNDSFVSLDKFSLKAPSVPQGLHTELRLIEQNAATGEVIIRIIVSTDAGLEANPQAPEITISKDITISGFQDQAQANSYRSIQILIDTIKNQGITIHQDYSSVFASQIVSDLSLEELRSGLVIPLPEGVDTAFELASVTANDQNGSATLVINFTNNGITKAESFQIQGFATRARKINQNLVDAQIEAFNNNRATNAEDFKVPFVASFVKNITTSDQVRVRDFTKNHTLSILSSEINSQARNLTLAVTKVQALEVDDPERETGKVLVSVLASLGQGPNQAQASYDFEISGFPSATQQSNQKAVNDYVQDRANRLNPVLVNSSLSKTKAARSVLLSDFRISEPPLNNVRLFLKRVSLNATKANAVDVTIRATAGLVLANGKLGSNAAENEYTVTFSDFLSETQEDILVALNELNTIIINAEAANNLKAIKNLIRRASDDITDPERNDIIIANRQGIAFSVAQITNFVSSSGLVSFNLQGTKDNTTFVSERIISAKLFINSDRLLISQAPELLWRTKGNIFVDAPTLEREAQFANYFELTKASDPQYSYQLQSIRALENNTSPGSSAILRVRVSLANKASVYREYNVTIRNLVPSATLANASLVKNFLESDQIATVVSVSQATKNQKSAPQLTPDDLLFNNLPSQISASSKLSDINQDPNEQTSALVKVTFRAGSGLNLFQAEKVYKITNLQLPNREANLLTLERYLLNRDHDQPKIKEGLVVSDLDVQFLNENKTNEAVLVYPARASLNQNIKQTISAIEQKGSENSALVKVTLTLGENARQATKEAIFEIHNLASALRANNLKIAQKYLELTNKELPRLSQNRQPNQVALSEVLANPSANFEINNANASHPQIAFSIKAVEQDLSLENGLGVVISVEISIPRNSEQSESLVRRIYEVKMQGFLNFQQATNYQKAKAYLDKNNLAEPVLKTTINKEITPISALSPNNFSFTNLPEGNGLSFEISNIEPLENSKTTAELTITIVSGSEKAASRALSYKKQISGFASNAGALNQEALSSYLNGQNLIQPSLNANINKAATSAQAIVASNFVIANPPQQEGKPIINLRVTNVRAISDNASEATKVEVTIEARVGSGNDLKTGEYKITISGFTSERRATNLRALEALKNSNIRPRPRLKNYEDLNTKSVSQLSVDSFAIDSPSSFIASISSLETHSESDTVAKLTIKLQKEGFASASDPAVTYEEMIPGFANTKKLENIKLVNAYLAKAKANNAQASILPSLKSDKEAKKAQLAVINLITSDYQAPDLASYENGKFNSLNIRVINIKEKGDSESDQRVALLEISVSLGNGEDFYRDTFTIEDSGFNDRASGENLLLINNYINSEAKVKPTIKTNSLTKDPKSINVEDLRIGTSGNKDINVKILSVKPSVSEEDLNHINDSAIMVTIEVTTKDNTKEDRGTYEVLVSGLRTLARVKTDNLAKLELSPKIFSDSNQTAALDERGINNILASSLNASNFKLVKDTSDNQNAEIDLSKFKITFDNLAPNNDTGTLSLDINLRYFESQQDQTLEASYLATYTVRLSGFLTINQQLVRNAPILEYQFSLDKTKFDASNTTSLQYDLTEAAKVKKAALDSNLTYEVKEVNSKEDGKVSELVIIISNLAKTSQREYKQQIQGFLSTNKFNNIKNVKLFLKTPSSKDLNVKSGVISSGSTTAVEFINKIEEDKAKNQGYDSNIFENFVLKDNNVNSSTLKRRLVSATLVEDNNTEVEVTIEIKGILGSEAEQIKETYKVIISGLQSQEASDLYKARSKITQAYNGDNAEYLFFKIKESKKNKIVELALDNSNDAVGDNFFTKDDFEKDSTKDFANLITKKKLHLAIKSVHNTSRDSLINGAISVNLEIYTEGEESSKQTFAVTISGFTTFNQLFDQYIKSDDRLKPSPKSNTDLDYRWNNVATAEKDRYEHLALSSEKENEKKFKVSVQDNDINIDITDDSIVNFRYRLSRNITLNLNNQSSTLDLNASYTEKVTGFKRNASRASQYRIQYNDQNLYLDSVSDSQANGAKRLFIRGDLETIGTTFQNNSSLKEIQLETGLVKIVENAFKNVNSNEFTSLTLPVTLQEIGAHAFKKAASLTTINGLEKTKIVYLKDSTFKAVTNSALKNKIYQFRIDQAKKMALIFTNNKTKLDFLPSDIKAKLKSTDNAPLTFEKREEFKAKGDLEFILEGTEHVNNNYGYLTIKYKINLIDPSVSESNDSRVVKSSDTFKIRLNSLKDVLRQDFSKINDASTYVDFSNLDSLTLQKDRQGFSRIVAVQDLNDSSSSYIAPTINSAPSIESSLDSQLESNFNPLGESEKRTAGFDNQGFRQLVNSSLANTSLVENGTLYLQFRVGNFYRKTGFARNAARWDLFGGQNTAFIVGDSGNDPSNSLGIVDKSNIRLTIGNTRTNGKNNFLVGTDDSEAVSSKKLDVIRKNALINGRTNEKGRLDIEHAFVNVPVILEVHRYKDRLQFTLYKHLANGKIERVAFAIKNPAYFEYAYNSLGANINSFVGNIGSVIAFNNPDKLLTYSERIKLVNALSHKWFSQTIYDIEQPNNLSSAGSKYNADGTKKTTDNTVTIWNLTDISNDLSENSWKTTDYPASDQGKISPFSERTS